MVQVFFSSASTPSSPSTSVWSVQAWNWFRATLWVARNSRGINLSRVRAVFWSFLNIFNVQGQYFILFDSWLYLKSQNIKERKQFAQNHLRKVLLISTPCSNFGLSMVTFKLMTWLWLPAQCLFCRIKTPFQKRCHGQPRTCSISLVLIVTSDKFDHLNALN